MPTNRRPILMRRGGSPVTLDSLTEFLLLEADNSEGMDLDFIEEWWAHNGERIVFEYIEKYPGTRPWPYYVFEVEEQRPIVNPDHDPAIDFALRRDQYFGVIHSGVYSVQRGRDGQLSQSPWQEREGDFLDRLGLLTQDERSRLGR